jgi:hypothetical protein
LLTILSGLKKQKIKQKVGPLRGPPFGDPFGGLQRGVRVTGFPQILRNEIPGHFQDISRTFQAIFQENF